MSRRNPRTAPGSSVSGGAVCTVSVCRGCCCGTGKIPGVDHPGQLEQLQQALSGSARVRRTECLDVCDQANVIVIQPSAAGRAAGGRPVWLGLVNDPAVIEDITAWLRTGGPGLADPPDVLDLYAFTPPRRVRQALSAATTATTGTARS